MELTSKFIKYQFLCLALVFSWSQAIASISDKECVECHGKKDIMGKNEAGANVSRYVDNTKLIVSAHKDIKCLQCHVAAAKLAPNPTKDLPHVKNIPRVSCNQTCHREGPPAQYNDSVHGRLAAQYKNQDVALCQDCHSGHEVVKCSGQPDGGVGCDPCQGCAKCHENDALTVKYNIHQKHPCAQWQLSAHGTPRMIDGKMRVPAVCTDCHGVHSIQGVGGPALSVRQPANCGKCHPKELDEYLKSIHGKEAANANPDAPLCIDCHGEHNILEAGKEGSMVSRRNVPDTCAACHARPSLMKKYGIEPDKLSTFINSIHGIALELNQGAAATCASCHGNHLVLPASDPNSSVYPANLPKTCGAPTCHPGMPKSIASAKIHVDYSSPKSGIIYWVQKFLVWALIFLLVITFIWVVPDIIEGYKVKRAKKRKLN